MRVRVRKNSPIVFSTSSCPRKVGKKKCRAKYALLMRNAKDSTALHAAILAGIERWRRSQDWVEDEGKFIKAPLVWLNQENWNDDPAPYAPRRTKAGRMTAAPKASNWIGSTAEQRKEFCDGLEG